MWVMRIEEVLLKEFCARHQHDPAQVTLTVRATTVRDGTPGISLTIDGKIIGEWTDSKATSLALTTDYQVAVYGRQGNILYLVAVPGVVWGGKQLSNTEIRISTRLSSSA